MFARKKEIIPCYLLTINGYLTLFVIENMTFGRLLVNISIGNHTGRSAIND